MAKKLVLGKGIASLINEVPKSIHAQEFLKKEAGENQAPDKSVDINPLLIPMEKIKVNPNQPRKIFKEKDLEELAQSIRENGIIQPILVRKIENGFEIIAGERRFRAAKKASQEYIPAIVKQITDKERNVIALIENIQRSDLNCVEEALAYYQLMNDFQLTQEEMSKKLGKDRSTIANYLRILKLPRNVIEFLQKEQLTFGHAKILAGFEDREEVIRLANNTIVHQWSVRELEENSKKKFKAREELDKNDTLFNKYDAFRLKLEQKSGLEYKIRTNKKGAGNVSLTFKNEAEFNDIYNFLMSK